MTKITKVLSGEEWRLNIKLSGINLILGGEIINIQWSHQIITRSSQLLKFQKYLNLIHHTPDTVVVDRIVGAVGDQTSKRQTEREENLRPGLQPDGGVQQEGKLRTDNITTHHPLSSNHSTLGVKRWAIPSSIPLSVTALMKKMMRTR